MIPNLIFLGTILIFMVTCCCIKGTSVQFCVRESLYILRTASYVQFTSDQADEWMLESPLCCLSWKSSQHWLDVVDPHFRGWSWTCNFSLLYTHFWTRQKLCLESEREKSNYFLHEIFINCRRFYTGDSFTFQDSPETVIIPAMAL